MQWDQPFPRRETKISWGRGRWWDNSPTPWQCMCMDQTCILSNATNVSLYFPKWPNRFGISMRRVTLPMVNPRILKWLRRFFWWFWAWSYRWHYGKRHSRAGYEVWWGCRGTLWEALPTQSRFHSDPDPGSCSSFIWRNPSSRWPQEIR